MRARTTAIVPLRQPGAGKSRLAEVLSPRARAELAVAMLGDVVAALAASSVDEVMIAADGPTAARAAAATGARVVLDPPGAGHLDAALAAAGAHVPADRDLLVVPADLPRLTAGDVDAVLATPAPVVVAPTAGGGTGALLRRVGARIATAYGPGSAVRHLAAARAAGLAVAEVERDGFHHDVDTWTDLVALHEVELGPRTARVLPTVLGHRARAG